MTEGGSKIIGMMREETINALSVMPAQSAGLDKAVRDYKRFMLLDAGRQLRRHAAGVGDRGVSVKFCQQRKQKKGAAHDRMAWGSQPLGHAIT